MESSLFFSPRSTINAAQAQRSASKTGMEATTKFFFAKRAKSTIRGDEQFQWSQNNFYRTSYGDMSSRVSNGQ